MELGILSELKKENNDLKAEIEQQKEVIRQLKALVKDLEKNINLELARMGL